MTGAGAVVALVLLEWTAGWVGVAAWTQSWNIVKRGHFRIVAWGVMVLGFLTIAADIAATGGLDGGALQRLLVGIMVGLCVCYLLVQFSRTDAPGAVVGGVAAAVGAAGLIAGADLIANWPAALAALELLSGSLLLGAVTNGMLLGHWYLNQPGLKPWALARLTALALAAIAASALLGIVSVGKLSNAETHGAVLGISGFGESFGLAFYLIWLILVVFTGGVLWGVRRCVQIRSIQSATGLYYVALLTAGVSEFLVRFLMVNAV